MATKAKPYTGRAFMFEQTEALVNLNRKADYSSSRSMALRRKGRTTPARSGSKSCGRPGERTGGLREGGCTDDRRG